MSNDPKRQIVDGQALWVQVMNGTRSLALAQNGQWLLIEQDNPTRVEVLLRHGPFTLWLLETPFSELLGRVAGFKECAGFTPFPFASVVVCGLKSESAYWVQKALDWCQYGRFSDREILELLGKIAFSTAFTQSIRHQAKRLWANQKRGPIGPESGDSH